MAESASEGYSQGIMARSLPLSPSRIDATAFPLGRPLARLLVCGGGHGTVSTMGLPNEELMNALLDAEYIVPLRCPQHRGCNGQEYGITAAGREHLRVIEARIEADESAGNGPIDLPSAIS
jgi:hypothetical protein